MPLIRSTPYSIAETIKWIFFYFFPSTRNQLQVKRTSRVYRNTEYLTEATVRLSFLGDIMCLHKEAVPDFPPVLKEILAGSDFVIANLEAPVVRDRKDNKYNAFVFSFSNEFLNEFLIKSSIKSESLVLNLANNHMADYDLWGYEQTLLRLKQMKIKTIGTVNDLIAPLILQVKNFRIGLWSYSQWLNCKGFSNDRTIMRKGHFDNLNILEMKKQYTLDYAIAFPHWGFEFRHFPDQNLYNYARQCEEQGFDLIAGHHSHVVMPLVRLKRVLCFFSLGNFFARTFHWASRIACIWTVDIVLNGVNKGKIAGYQINPFFLMRKKDHYYFEEWGSAPKKVKTRFNLIYPE